MTAMANRMTLAVCFIIFFSTGGLSADDCGGGWDDLREQCFQYVRIPGPPTAPTPGPECCAVVKAADIPCTCSHVTPELQQIVNMTRVVDDAAICGRPFPPGYQCGSFKVPHME